METLHEQAVAEPLEGCTPLSGCDLPSCGRYLAISTRPLEARIHRWPNHHFRNGTETMALMCDVEAQRQASSITARHLKCPWHRQPSYAQPRGCILPLVGIVFPGPSDGV